MMGHERAPPHGENHQSSESLSAPLVGSVDGVDGLEGSLKHYHPSRGSFEFALRPGLQSRASLEAECLHTSPHLGLKRFAPVEFGNLAELLFA